MSQLILEKCRATNTRVTNTLVEISKREDVTEFTTTIQLIQVTINNLLKGSKTSTFDLVLLKDLQGSLEDYEALLSQLNSQPGGLVRFFTSNRLRRKIELANSQLHSKLEKFRESIKETDKPESSSRSDSAGSSSSNLLETLSLEEESDAITNPFHLSLMIEDVEGKDLWAHLFGLETFMVKWDKFVASLRTIFPELEEDESRVLQSILDNSNTGCINQHKFSEFLKGFGPIQDCIKNVRSVTSARWFYGFLSRTECELLLRDWPVGTFLIRFSSSQPGSFALAYTAVQRGEKSTFHILINSCKPTGFQVPENNTTRNFKNLYEIVEYYSVFLQFPYNSELPFESWFEGDYSSSEATEVLNGHKCGTYLVRFSSSAFGAFAVSFVTGEGQVGHSLIDKTTAGYRIEETPTFKTLPELITYYGATLQFPYKSVANEVFVEASGIILQWKKEREKKMEVVDKMVVDLFNLNVPLQLGPKVDEKDPRVTALIARIFDS